MCYRLIYNKNNINIVKELDYEYDKLQEIATMSLESLGPKLIYSEIKVK